MRAFIGKPELLIAGGCFLLGFLYVESNRVSPEYHHHYQQEISRLSALDTRINQDVLRAGAGLLRHYDALVRIAREREQAIERISAAPTYMDPEQRIVYEAALARYASAIEAKSRLEEQFKSAHAAVRGSLTYFPIVARSLVESVQAKKFDHPLVGRVRDDVGRIFAYMAVGGGAERSSAQLALQDLRELVLEPVPAIDPALFAAVMTHSNNVLERKPQLDALIVRVVGASTTSALEELRVAYGAGYSRAATRADRFQLVLYLCSALMLVLVAVAIRRLNVARTSLKTANEDLERRVQERTAELSEAKDRVEADGRDLQDLNDRLQTSHRELDETRRDQLALRDKLLSHVSHELRTPLTAIHQFVSLVLDEVAGAVPEAQREYLEVAFRNVNQLTTMIADLMEVTRAQSGKLRLECRPVGLAELIEEVVSTLRSKAGENGITLAARCEGDTSNAYADPVRVRQILNNLIENAIKFTPEGGSIEVSLARDESICALQVSVRDTGCGISNGGIHRVFDQLHQEEAAEVRSRKGLGLGLSICKELVERQDGRIWVESTVGEGSIFHFTLPEFRLEELIEGVVRSENEVAEECAVVRVDIQPATPGNLPETLRREVRHKLGRLVYVESDAILPRLEWHPNHEQFWLVAATGEVGASTIRERIEKALVSDPEPEDIVLEVESRVFPLGASGKDDAHVAKSIRMIAEFIHDQMQEEREKWKSTRS